MKRVSPGSQPTVKIVVRRWVIAEVREALRRRDDLVEVQHRLAHAHEDGVVDRLDAPEVKCLVEDLPGREVAPNCICPVAQNVHVSGQPDCDETQTERRPSRNRIRTASSGWPSWVWKSAFTVPSTDFASCTSVSVENGACSSSSARNATGRFVISP